MSSVMLPPSQVDEIEPSSNASRQDIVKEVVGPPPTALSAAALQEESYRHFQSEIGLDLWMFGGMFFALGIIILIGFGSFVAMGGLFALGAGAFGLGFWVRPGAH